jgi:hypothetical protein
MGGAPQLGVPELLALQRSVGNAAVTAAVMEAHSRVAPGTPAAGRQRLIQRVIYKDADAMAQEQSYVDYAQSDWYGKLPPAKQAILDVLHHAEEKYPLDKALETADILYNAKLKFQYFTAAKAALSDQSARFYKAHRRGRHPRSRGLE